MSFKDCIQTAVETGRLGAAKAAEAADAYDTAFAANKADGLSDDAAGDLASTQALEEVTSLKAAKRWQRVNEMRKAHTLYEQFVDTANPRQALMEVPRRMEFAYNRIRAQAMAGLDTFILQYMPKLGGLQVPTYNLDNIVRAVFGDVRNAEAKAMADSIMEVRKFLGNRANMEGASIDSKSSSNLPQTHDRIKVRKVDEDEWVSDHMNALDWNTMRYDGKPIPSHLREEVLRRTYQGIITDGDIRLRAGQADNMGLASRMSRDRFLWYKDADSWLSMQDKYGMGNVHQQILGMIDSYSRDISIMEHLGPNPNTMQSYVERLAKQRAAQLEVADKRKGKSWVADTREGIQSFQEQLQLHSLAIMNGEENIWAQTANTARTVSSSSLLGGVYLASLGDIAVAKWARQFHGMPESGVIRNYLDHFINNKASAQQAIRSGIVFESGISLASARQRFFGPLDGAHWAQRFSDIVYRSGLATLHTQSMKNMSGLELLGLFADNAGKKLDDLEFADSLRNFGITEKDWDIFRATPLHNDRGATFLRPLDLWAIAKTDVEKRAADKFGDFMQMFINDAVPTPDLRTRAAIGGTTPATSLYGQMTRTASQLTSFPATIFFNHLQRIVNMPNPKDKLEQGARFFIYLTLGGAFVTQMKALAQGRDPHDMTTLDFWGRSVVNGGSFGILGDFIFNNINVSNSRFRPESPMAQQWKAIQGLTIDNLVDYANGEELKIGADTVKAANALMPRLWWFRAVWDRAVSDEMLKVSDPKAYQKLIETQRGNEEETGQGMWWGTGQDARAPNLESAVGG